MNPVDRLPALTVAGLVAIPHLRTRVIAGKEGLENTVTWAHTTEVARPWEWLEEGDLLMTIGMGVPVAADEQVEWINELARVGVSGVAVGENMHAPALSGEMLAAAEHHRLPLLLTQYEVPFSEISRAVAASADTYLAARSRDVSKVYNALRAWYAHGTEGGILAALEEIARCKLYLCDNETLNPILSQGSALPDDLREPARVALLERDGLLPGVVRFATRDRREVSMVAVPTARSASLVSVSDQAGGPPLMLLQHVATALAVELERQTATRARARQLGAEAFQGMLSGTVAFATAEEQFRTAGLDARVLVVAATPAALTGPVQDRLDDAGVGHLALVRGDRLCILLPNDGEALERLAVAVGADTRIGVSETFRSVDGVRTAVREACWALDVELDPPRQLVHYEEHGSPIGLRSMTEAQSLVDMVLGDLLQYDQDHDTELVHSLRVLLEENRSWRQAADRLFIHKQTLVYRMRRVEKLSGRSLTTTASVAELWFALEALQRLEHARDIPTELGVPAP